MRDEFNVGQKFISYNGLLLPSSTVEQIKRKTYGSYQGAREKARRIRQARCAEEKRMSKLHAVERSSPTV